MLFLGIIIGVLIGAVGGGFLIFWIVTASFRPRF